VWRCGGVTEKKQPGVEIDADVWRRFRQEVSDRRGGVRGHLRTEVENALLDYIHGGDTTPNEINARLQRIEAAVGAAEADGGTDTSDGDSHTHTPTDRIPEEKPAANAATEKKLRYLAASLRERTTGDRDGDLISATKSDIRDVVKDEYGFRSDTAQRYVTQLRDHLGFVEHPKNDVVLVTPDRREELLEQNAADTLEGLE
jgi:hypothetical protein